MDTDPGAQIFGSEDFDLYVALGLDKSASEGEIKSAYRRGALKCHPDKQAASASAEDKAAAVSKFQQVGYAYAVLSDTERRKRYDATGRTDETLLPSDADAWQSYFEELWEGQVNASTIDEFFAKYTGSEEEKADVADAYQQSQGDVEFLLANCMTADSVTAEEHLCAIVNSAIKAGELEATERWKQSSKDKKAKAKRVKAAKKEAAEAEAMAKEMGVHDKLYGQPKKGKGKQQQGGGEDALKALIQQRGAQRMEASMAALEAKYGGGGESSSSSKKSASKKGKGSSKKRKDEPLIDAEPDISDADFAAIQAKMLKDASDSKSKASDSSGSSKRRKKS